MSSVLPSIPVYSQTGAPEGIKSQDLTAHPFLAVRKTYAKISLNTQLQNQYIFH